MQTLFLIRDGEVIIQNSLESYSDTLENFRKDLGKQIPFENLDYNKAFKFLIVDGKRLAYPNDFCEEVLANVKNLLLAQKERQPRPPESELEPEGSSLEDRMKFLEADNEQMNDTMLAIIEMLDIASE